MTLQEQHLEKRFALEMKMETIIMNINLVDDGARIFMTTESVCNASVEAANLCKEYAKGFARWIKTSGYENVHDEQKYWVNIKAPVGHIYKDTDQLLSLYDDHLAKLEKEKIK